jgi:hypothetical protein
LGWIQKNDGISSNIEFIRNSECSKLIPQPLLLAREGELKVFFTPSLKEREGERG